MVHLFYSWGSFFFFSFNFFINMWSDSCSWVNLKSSIFRCCVNSGISIMSRLLLVMGQMICKVISCFYLMGRYQTLKWRIWISSWPHLWFWSYLELSLRFKHHLLTWKLILSLPSFLPNFLQWSWSAKICDKLHVDMHEWLMKNIDINEWVEDRL